MPAQTNDTIAASELVAMRQRCMRAFALADRTALEQAWAAWSPAPEIEAVRGPERGLVMVRGRIGGSGDRFNLGEATVARATVRLHGGALANDTVGTSYLLGTDLEHARLAAIFDGLLLDPTLRARVLSEVVEPLETAQREHEAAEQADARSTLVDFFTVSREHE
ncbi:MAG TPA: phosphonate C-P lyase system protein PhnG [Gryllotalpicola sp.]